MKKLWLYLVIMLTLPWLMGMIWSVIGTYFSKDLQAIPQKYLVQWESTSDYSITILNNSVKVSRENDETTECVATSIKLGYSYSKDKLRYKYDWKFHPIYDFLALLQQHFIKILPPAFFGNEEVSLECEGSYEREPMTFYLEEPYSYGHKKHMNILISFEDSHVIDWTIYLEQY